MAYRCVMDRLLFGAPRGAVSLAVLSLIVLSWLVGGGCVPVSMARAGTPADMAVMAWQIDELISLDPAEAYEFAGVEILSSIYDRLVYHEPEQTQSADQSPLEGPGAAVRGGVADRWEISEDGRTFTFHIRDGIQFPSGHPLTAQDAAWSLTRVVMLDKGPASILAPFGLTAETVKDYVQAPDDSTLVIRTDRRYAPDLILSVLASWVSSVVDSKTVMAHAQPLDGTDGDRRTDWGNGWLRTHSAGSGPFSLGLWRPSDIVVLDRFPGHWRGPAGMAQVVIQHVPISMSQRFMLENGDVDIARNLSPSDLAALQASPFVTVTRAPQAALTYMGLNQKNPILANPKVREALKWLVDYDGLARTVLAGTKVVHESFVPSGFMGAIDDQPYHLDVERARALLTEAGYPDGFSVSIDARTTYPTADLAQALKRTWKQAGIDLTINALDHKQALTRYRAREHDIYIGRWDPDFTDPHANAMGFAWNPDNSDDSTVRMLAWRNAWDIPKMTAETEAALVETNLDARRTMYEDLQREHMATSPFIIMFENIAVTAQRFDVIGFSLGPTFDTVSYRTIAKLRR